MITGEQLFQSLINWGRPGIFLEHQVIRAGEQGIFLSPVQIQRPGGGGRQTSSGSKQVRLVGRGKDQGKALGSEGCVGSEISGEHT